MKKRFYVDKEKGVVVATYCHMDGTPKKVELAPNEIAESFGGDLRTSSIAYSCVMTDPRIDADAKFKAVSKCREGDVFDEHIGKEIAGSVLDMKYHDRMARDYDKYIQDLNSTISKLERLRNKHTKKVQNIKDDLKRCYGVE